METLFAVLAFTVENSDRKYSCLEQRSMAWVNNGELFLIAFHGGSQMLLQGSSTSYV